MELLVDVSLRVLIVAAVAALAAWRRPAALGHAVWSAALISMLLMPALVRALPELPIAVWPAAEQVAPLEVSAEQGQALPSTPAAPPPAPWWPRALAMVYCAGVALLAVRLAVALAAALRVARHSERVLDFRALQFAEGCEVYETEAARVPVTVGSRIVLPRVWREWDDAALAAALAHEAAHVRRRDWWFALIAGLNRCVFWFHPVAWWLERRLSDLAEQAADDASLIATGNRRAYARLLVEMAQTIQGGRRMAWEALAMARPSGVSRRVEAALDETRRLSAGLGRAAAAAVLGGAAVLVFGIGATRLVAQERPAPPPPPVTTVGPSSQLQADAVPQAEAKVAANPDDFTAREGLIRHYWSTRDVDKWKRHLTAYIERWPESVRFTEPAFRRIPETSGDADLRRLWDRMVQQRPNDARVAVNAARNLADLGELADASALLVRARQLDPNDNQAPFVAADILVRALTAGGPLAENAKRDLETTTDVRLLRLAAVMLAPSARTNTSVAELLKRLRERSLQIDPSAPPLPPPPPGFSGPEKVVSLRERGAAAGGVPGGVAGGVPGGVSGGVPGGATTGVQRIRVGGNVQAAKLKHAVQPEYPPLARQARIQGVVRFRAVIAADGAVSNLQLTSGHPLLVPAAQEAVMQYRYDTTLLNGTPVEIVTTVDVPFKLDAEI